MDEDQVGSRNKTAMDPLVAWLPHLKEDHVVKEKKVDCN
jgi:hypothetical protein